MEAEARAEAETMLAQAEADSKGLVAQAVEEAKANAQERRLQLETQLRERTDAWRARYDAMREQIVKRIVATVIAEDADGD
jgi:F0F1-type ATP synthase membrane subunit b/b'